MHLANFYKLSRHGKRRTVNDLQKEGALMICSRRPIFLVLSPLLFCPSTFVDWCRSSAISEHELICLGHLQARRHVPKQAPGTEILNSISRTWWLQPFNDPMVTVTCTRWQASAFCFQPCWSAAQLFIGAPTLKHARSLVSDRSARVPWLPFVRLPTPLCGFQRSQ